MNFRIKRHILEPTAVLITGDRGAGKSTLFALIIQQAKKYGIPCYSQYPYKDCYQLPMVSKLVNGVKRLDVDKEFLYTHNFNDSIILLDEVKTIWNARSFKNWTSADEEFFNYLRKTNTRVYMATQSYDGVDINVRRAVDEVYYLTKGFWHFTHIEASHTTIARVADKQTEVVGRLFKAGMRKVVWDICEVPTGHYLFWRKPFYNDFFSYFTYDEKKPIKQVSWSDKFPELGSKEVKHIAKA